MRGEYYTSDEDRRRFFHALNKLCQENEDDVDLIGSQLCLRDCLVLLGELGYEQGSWDVDGGEGEIWVACYQEDCPPLTVLSDGFLGRLKIFFQDGNDVDEEKIKELMRKHWGKYFPVI